MKIKILDFDIYSKRIGLFYQNKEKLGTSFGIILTIIYVVISLGLFITYITDIIKRKNINIHDSSIYPKKAPSIELDKQFFYFAFGVESPNDRTRFIDNTIYYPRVYYFDKVKDGGNLKTIHEEELEVERCDEEKFGKDYQSLLVSGELNNSYCLKDINFTLTGGLKYERMSYIIIGIYPCINTTENHNHCKPQKIIDEHLSGAYFSFLAKDIGLNPSNYSNPITPIFQDFFTTIDKSFFRDYVLYFGITEIQTDIGIFYTKIRTQTILQIKKEAKAFYFRDDSHYYKGDSMCSIQFRLGDDIKIHKRSYNKISEVFANTGGYMQLISTIFTIVTFLTNKLETQIKFSNSLFNLYPNKRKICVKSEFSNLIDSINNDNNIKYNSHNNISKNQESNKNNYHNFKKEVDKFESTNINDPKILKINNNPEKNNINKSNLKINSIIEENKNNKSKISLLQNKIDNYSPNMNNQLHILKKIENKQDNYMFDQNIQITDNFISKNININMSIYCLFLNCKKNKINVKLFNKGISFYRKKLDIIHLFNIILLTEIIASKYQYKINNK